MREDVDGKCQMEEQSNDECGSIDEGWEDDDLCGIRWSVVHRHLLS
jgi:hypothetical protein